MDAKYKKANLPEVVKNNCKHLNAAEREELLKLLQKYEELFDGTLGDWKTEPVKLELKKDAKPFHSRPFQVPKIYVETLKKEIERLVELGILEWFMSLNGHHRHS